MKLALSLVAALATMGSVATAASVTFQVAEDTSFNLEGTLLGTGFSVTGGWYDTGLGLDYATIAANFVAAPGSIAFPYAGNAAFNGYTAGDTAVFDSTALALADKNIFWLVTDGSTGFALLEDTGNTFKPESAIPNTSSSILNATTYVNFTQHVTAPGSSVASIGLVPIPEPSAALLGGLGVLGLLRRRRN